jgi:hypothetical protein
MEFFNDGGQRHSRPSREGTRCVYGYYHLQQHERIN